MMCNIENRRKLWTVMTVILKIAEWLMTVQAPNQRATYVNVTTSGLVNISRHSQNLHLCTKCEYRFKLCSTMYENTSKCTLFLAQCSYTKIAQRIFKHSDMQYTILTLDKKLNSLIYRTLFYVNIYDSYKLSNTVRFFDPACNSVSPLNYWQHIHG